ncbi:unnamed protein product [Schistosoma curassoni]|uniref:HTH LytTR-type domain-containing protein n=1 Tax=Schistosoma curassoni TaxID=6186 RepID=A0A183KB32_9TREM|nr:unnamed protein product [Schistosoma curassoni]
MSVKSFPVSSYKETAPGTHRNFKQSKTCPLRVEDTRKLLVFDHRCLRNIAGTCWDHRVSNSEVRRRVLGNDGKSVDEVVNLHRLRWLGHVLRMPEHRLPRRPMLTGVGDGWKKVVVGGSREETLDPGFVLLGTRQQGVPVIATQ